jgi:drug/metabolite transporter (DMT)-like permease
MAAVLWGFGGVFAVLVSSPSLVLSFYRLWAGAVLLTVILYVSGRRLSLRAFRGSWIAGLLLGGDLVMFYSAIKLTSVVDATVIGALQPVIVILLARPLFGEKLRRWDLAWVTLAVVGVLVAVVGAGSKSHHQVSGDLFAIASRTRCDGVHRLRDDCRVTGRDAHRAVVQSVARAGTNR